jgi:hypothetical protein
LIFKPAFGPVQSNGVSQSPPHILRWVAYPVKPLGFKFVSNQPPPPLLDRIRDRLGKRPSLFDELDDGQANELQCIHKMSVRLSIHHGVSAPTMEPANTLIAWGQ